MYTRKNIETCFVPSSKITQTKQQQRENNKPQKQQQFHLQWTKKKKKTCDKLFVCLKKNRKQKLNENGLFFDEFCKIFTKVQHTVGLKEIKLRLKKKPTK